MTRLAAHLYGRDIEVVIADETDAFGQFQVALYVGGKERYKAHFNDKSEDVVDRLRQAGK